MDYPLYSYFWQNLTLNFNHIYFKATFMVMQILIITRRCFRNTAKRKNFAS